MPSLKVKKKESQWYCAKADLETGELGMVVPSPKTFEIQFADILHRGKCSVIYALAKSEAEATARMNRQLKHYMTTRSVEEKSKATSTSKVKAA